jgi:hypothetical protein
MKQHEGILKTYRQEIVLPSIDSVVYFQPFGDVHRESENCHVKAWKDFLKIAKESDTPYTYYLSMGDTSDLASGSEREILDKGDLHESTRETLDAIAKKQTDSFAKEIEFMHERMLGLVEGNHYYTFERGQTSTQYLAELCGSRWLGTLAYIRLSITFANTGRKGVAVDIVAHHGRAGGKLLGTTINQVSDLRNIFSAADIYIMGHDHRKGVLPDSTLVVKSIKKGLEVVDKPQWFCRSGSFLRGYVENKRSYVTRGLLRPANLGVIRGEIRFTRSRDGSKDTIRPDIHFWS